MTWLVCYLARVLLKMSDLAADGNRCLQKSETTALPNSDEKPFAFCGYPAKNARIWMTTFIL